MSALDDLIARDSGAGSGGSALDALIARDSGGAAQMQASPAAPASGGYFADRAGELGNMVAGGLRGAGSIGATLLSPIDAAARFANGGRPVNVNGYDIVGQDRRAGMDAGLRSAGADPNSTAFQAGKIGMEIAGAAGAGGAVANTIGRIPGAAAALPSLLPAIRTGGMAANGATGAYGMAARTAGGAVNGAATAGMLNPEDAGAGSMIGAAFPGAVKLLGAAGGKIGSMFSSAPLSPGIAQAATAARGAGYVIPPADTNPTMINELLNGLSGKIKTAQSASAQNQSVTNNLARNSVGAPLDQPLTIDGLNSIRNQAGQAYQAVSSTGTIRPGQAYSDALDAITSPYVQAAKGFPGAKPSPIIDEINGLKSPEFDASSAVSKISSLRADSTAAYASGDKARGQALKGGANALEDAIDSHLTDIGAPADMLDNFRNARQLIAKTYSVQKGLNDVTGDVSAQTLAKQLQKGRPLSGDLLTIAQAGSAFPKALQSLTEAPKQLSPLDFMGGLMAATASGHPAAALLPIMRPAVRAGLLSGAYQRGMGTASNGEGQIGGLLNDSLPSMYRINGLLGVNDR